MPEKIKNNKTKVFIGCNRHGFFKQKINNHLNGQGCPSCFQGKISKSQKEIHEFLSKNTKKAILEKRIILNNKTFYADIFIPQKNIIVEYNGDYWHCNPEKYESSYFHPHYKKTAREVWAKDNNRQKLLENNGYKIIIIWENDYKNNKEKILNKIIEKLNDAKKTDIQASGAKIQ
jgi:G:T-mismatch repair DNA endonuclease (very short patch repair protein)